MEKKPLFFQPLTQTFEPALKAECKPFAAVVPEPSAERKNLQGSRH
jgi:hypothetical protein